ncbi:MAG: glycosyltransferase [Rhodocyclaceae bacterium]|nr:MAG: glycosyltransferase [Rhodocyclaceae bacterium]TND03530.1 MAG: glycosyltransferase [Rhodocyclaceae bacterium]
MKQLVHIVEPFDVAWSGSSQRALALWNLLRDHGKVRLWAHGNVDPCYGEYSILQISGDVAPDGGTLIIVGGYYAPGPWLERGDFQRVIVIFNVPEYGHLYRLLGRIRVAKLPPAELLFASSLLRDIAALDGLIEPSPISLAAFTPMKEEPRRPFTIGRLSRDREFKHHEDDPSLYRMLGLQGHRLRIMGGTCLEPHLGIDRSGIELLAAGALPAADFLRTLDCFFYRNHPSFLESFGRVVLEAMACGLPVVCERRGGYVEWIRDGENGFLFETQEQAWEILQALSGDKELRQAIGAAARRTMEEVYGEMPRTRFRAWYLGYANTPPVAGSPASAA